MGCASLTTSWRLRGRSHLVAQTQKVQQWRTGFQLAVKPNELLTKANIRNLKMLYSARRTIILVSNGVRNDFIVRRVVSHSVAELGVDERDEYISMPKLVENSVFIA